jgi:hypothetical protein
VIGRVAERPAHPFNDFHMLDSRFQRFGSDAHCVGRGPTHRLGGGALVLCGNTRRLGRLTKALAFLSLRLVRVTMLVTKLALFLGRSAAVFRIIPGRLGCHAESLGVFAIGVWRNALIFHGCICSMA